MAAETEVREEITVLSEVRVDENCQVDTKDLPKVGGDCDRAASEAVSDYNGEAETGKNGNSMGEDDPDGSYVFISRSNSVNGDSIEKTLLEGDPGSPDGSLNHNKEVLVQKLSADNGEAVSEESKVDHEANESHLFGNVEPVVLAVKPVIDGSHTELANGTQEEREGADHESIHLVSASQGGEVSPILILSADDPQLDNGVAKIGVVDQESIPDLDETCLASKLREAPESEVVGSDVGNSYVQESEEINGVSLGSIECTPALIDDVKIQYEEENKIGSETETEKTHVAPLIDDIKINEDLEEHKGVDHEPIQLDSASEEVQLSPTLILNVVDPHIDNGMAKIGVVDHKSTPELDVTCLASKLGEAPESGVLGSDVGNINEDKINLESTCRGQESEEIKVMSLKSTECTQPLIDGIKVQYEEERKTGSDTETEKIHVAPLIDDIKVNGDLEEQIGEHHEPIQLNFASEGGGESPISILNAGDSQLENSVSKIGVTDQESSPVLDETCLASEVRDTPESEVIGSDIGSIKEEKTNSESYHGQESEEIDEGVSLGSTECTPPLNDDMKIQYEEESKLGSETETEKIHIPSLIDDSKVNGAQEEHIGADHEPSQSELDGISPILTSNAVDPQTHNGVDKIGVPDDIKANGAQEEHSGVDHEPIQSEDDVSSPILISNAVDPKIPNGVDKIIVTEQDSVPELDETFLASKLVEPSEFGVIVSDIDNNKDKTNLESTCHGQGSERKDVPLVSTECASAGTDDIKIQFEETKIGSYTDTEKIHAAPLIDDGKVNSDKEVIIESDRKIEMIEECKSIEPEATGRKQPQVEDESKAEPPILMKEALTSENTTPQSSDEASQLEHGEENIEEQEKIDGSQNFQESVLEVDLSKEVAKVANEAVVPVVGGTSSTNSNEDIKVVLSSDEICNLGAEVPNQPTVASLEDKNVPLDNCLLVEPVLTSPDPSLSSPCVENESGMLNGVKAPLSTDSLENGDEADLKLEHETENSSSSNDAHVCKPKDVDTDDKKSDVQDEAVGNGANTENSDGQNEEPKIDVVEQTDRDVTLPSTTEDAESKSNAPEEESVGFQFVKSPFNYLIKMPRYEDDGLRKQIESAHQEVEEKTKNRDVTKAEIKDKKVKSQELQAIFESAKSEEKAARGLVKSKRQEIDAVQSIINKVKNAITVDDIDIRIRGMEHMIQHETLPLKDEKQYIREIKQLRHLREQLSSSLGSQEDVQLALNQKDESEERMKILKKELDRLKDTVSNTEEAARAAWKKLDEVKNKIRELYVVFTSEDDTRQEAFRRLQNLKKQLRDKNVWFRRYKDEEECANGYAASGDKEVLHLFCANQVSKIMGQWNTDEEFRKEYIRCNERSILRRFGTRDGRALGPDEEPPIIPKAWDRRTDQSVVAPVKKVNSKKLPVVEGGESKGKPAEKEDVVLIEQNLKTEVPAEIPANNPPISVQSSAPIEEKSGEPVDVKEKEPEKTKEEIEAERKAEELRKEEEMVRMKELRKVEEKVKEKEALDRKRRNAEKATVRAELRAQKEAEQKEKEREKKLRKKERKKTGGAEEEGTREWGSSQTGWDSPKDVAVTREVAEMMINENSSSSSLLTTTTTNTKKLSAAPMKAATIQLSKQTKSKLTPPPALRNKGKRRMQQWIWAISITVLVIVLFFMGNVGFYSSLKDRKSGL
ncbi:uncharacterized protein LOC124931269 [Impatiens glandulifera]|uniref:uncharacterized protein LOC124931269 n=1 Tax=Impatiens glandulifera TaxID=253017 RepID=UPI001FB1490A|nr:uncharacterized protein LOC124931269 [Impatiens glandulifera]XP_047327657.1 uncharacterized protein LOC124931269 [Impatiens glandulifera]